MTTITIAKTLEPWWGTADMVSGKLVAELGWFVTLAEWIELQKAQKGMQKA